MDIKEMIKEAHESADKAIKEAQKNATAWYLLPVNISRGQALLIAVAVIAILVIF
jgi:hypothetical protein